MLMIWENSASSSTPSVTALREQHRDVLPRPLALSTCRASMESWVEEERRRGRAEAGACLPDGAAATTVKAAKQKNFKMALANPARHGLTGCAPVGEVEAREGQALSVLDAVAIDLEGRLSLLLSHATREFFCSSTRDDLRTRKRRGKRFQIWMRCRGERWARVPGPRMVLHSPAGA